MPTVTAAKKFTASPTPGGKAKTGGSSTPPPAKTASAAKTARAATATKATKAAKTTKAATGKPANAAIPDTGAATAATPATGTAQAMKPPAKATKARLVRDSFTMPQADFSLIAVLKQRALKFQRPAKKSELLRAGLHALQAMDDAVLHAALESLVPLKPGRPKAGD